MRAQRASLTHQRMRALASGDYIRDGGRVRGARVQQTVAVKRQCRRNCEGAPMLTLTENAQVAIRTIASEAGLPDSGGVRITMADAGDQFEMSLAPEPALSDAV